jgi:hypothetical protein
VCRRHYVTYLVASMAATTATPLPSWASGATLSLKQVDSISKCRGDTNKALCTARSQMARATSNRLLQSFCKDKAQHPPADPPNLWQSHEHFSTRTQACPRTDLDVSAVSGIRSYAPNRWTWWWHSSTPQQRCCDVSSTVVPAMRQPQRLIFHCLTFASVSGLLFHVLGRQWWVELSLMPAACPGRTAQP